MKRRWSRSLLNVLGRMCQSRAAVVAVFTATGALGTGAVADASTTPSEARADIPARIAAVRTALREGRTKPETADEPPDRTMQWANWPNWPNWNNWRNWNNWPNWVNWGNY